MNEFNMTGEQFIRGQSVDTVRWMRDTALFIGKVAINELDNTTYGEFYDTMYPKYPNQTYEIWLKFMTEFQQAATDFNLTNNSEYAKYAYEIDQWKNRSFEEW